MTADELLLTQAWKLFVRRHAGPYRVVVGGDVLEALFAHSLRDQSLGFLDRLNQFAWRHAELFSAKTLRRLRLRRGDRRREQDGEQARVNFPFHGAILSN